MRSVAKIRASGAIGKKAHHQAQRVSRKKGKNRSVSKNTVTPSRLDSGTKTSTAELYRKSRLKPGDTGLRGK